MLLKQPLAGTELDDVDDLLAAHATRIERTRKRRVWQVWVDGRPIHVEASAVEAVVSLCAGCNSPEDWRVLSSLAAALATRFDGLAEEPAK